jgi:hypothetical protein
MNVVAWASGKASGATSTAHPSEPRFPRAAVVHGATVTVQHCGHGSAVTVRPGLVVNPTPAMPRYQTHPGRLNGRRTGARESRPWRRRGNPKNDISTSHGCRQPHCQVRPHRSYRKPVESSEPQDLTFARGECGRLPDRLPEEVRDIVPSCRAFATSLLQREAPRPPSAAMVHGYFPQLRSPK